MLAHIPRDAPSNSSTEATGTRTDGRARADIVPSDRYPGPVPAVRTAPPGQGAVPLHKPYRVSDSGAERANDERAKTERHSKNKERLLVIDSDPACRNLVSEIAKELGYSVDVSRNGREFRESYKRLQPTVVVLDLLLPDEDGIQLLKFLKEETSNARIIVISEVDDRLRNATNTLASAYGLRLIANLPKPIEPNDLRSALDPAAAPLRDRAG